MFTQSVFIKKNTPELRNKMRELGYRIMVSAESEDKPYLFTSFGCLVGKEFEDYPLGTHNCGTNEKLFVALSALRNDSDKYQFFTDGIHWEIYPLEEFINDDMIRKWELRYNELGVKYKPHKATVQELIQHFKDK